MKSRKIFNISLTKAQIFYSVFQSCGVFSVLEDGKLIPVYDFSGNCMRSTLNSLRNEGFATSRFHFNCCYLDSSELPTPYSMCFTHCYVYF